MIKLNLAYLAHLDLALARAVFRGVCLALWEHCAARVGAANVATLEAFETWFHGEWERVTALEGGVYDVDAEWLRQQILDHVLALAVTVDDLNAALRGDEECD